MQAKSKSCVMGGAFDYLHKSLSKLKAGLRVIALGLGVLGVFNSAWGVCTNVTITGAVGGQANAITLCDFSVATTGEIVGAVGAGIENSGIIDTLTNSGMISGDALHGIENFGTIGTLTNSGTISGGSQGGIIPGGGITNAGTIGTLTNSGTISITSWNIFGIRNFGTIGTLTNSGTIISSNEVTVIDNYMFSTITMLTNSGTISSHGEGVTNAGNIETLINTNSGAILSQSLSFIYQAGIYNRATIGTLTNSGTISSISGDGIYNIGVINTLTNTKGGTVSGAMLGNSGIYNEFSSQIGTLTNSGTISGATSDSSGIYNKGTIGTLNNAQGSTGSALTYVGTLPTNYNIIVNGAGSYGQLQAISIYSPITGTTNFGISSLSSSSSTALNVRLPGVLQGFTSPLTSYVNGLIVVGSTYTYTSASYSYYLVEGTTLGTWDLTITACSICVGMSDITVGLSVGLSNIGVTVYPVFAGGTLVLNSGDSSTQAFSVLGAGGVIQSPTSGSATLSSVFSGAGGLTFTGTGTTILTGANTYSGGTTVSAGTLQGNTTSLQGAIVNNSQVVFDQATDGTYSGVMSGSGSLTKQNVGTLILTGANTYSGGTTVSAGSLQGNTTSLQGAIVNNSQVVFDQATDGTYSGVMSGSGALTKQNAGTLILTGANTYSGGTTVSAGTLQGNTTSLQGAIVNNSQVVFDQATDGTYSGVMSGSGSLTKQNTGTLMLTGANTYSGGTTVSGGTLVVAGASPTGAGDVVISSPGTLMGTGTIAGNGIVSGVLKPGNSPGYLSFAQNLTLNAGSTYQQDIAGTTQASSTTPVGASGYYAFVNVGSQLVINSGATLTPRLSNLFSASEAGYGSSIYAPVLGDRFRIIAAAGGITGRFTTLTQPAELSSGKQLIAFYNVSNSNSVDLVTVPTSYGTTLASSTTNAKSVADVLDQLLGVNKAGTSSSAQDSLLYAVAGQNAANLSGFARSLAGEIHAASVATLPQTTQRVQQAVLARLGDDLMAPSQMNPALNNALSTGGISATNPSGLPTANMSTNPAVNPSTTNVTSAAVKDGRAWGEIAYQRTDRASNSAGNGYNSNLYQIVTGVDAYSNAALGLKLGGGLALSNTTVAAKGGNSTIQQGSLFVYGKMPVLQDYVLDGMASVGLSSTNLSRNDPTGYTGGFSHKGVMGNDALVSVGLSRPFDYNDVRLTPYARLSYQYVGQNAYDEGSGAAALSIAGFSGSAVRGVIGLAAGSSNKDPLKAEYTYRANIAVGADTSGLLNPTLNTTLGGYSSSVTTATAGSAFVQVGLYGSVKISDNAYAYVGVSGEARTGQSLYGGSVGLRMAF
jgi:autotransporter-associated beta strand protein